MAHIVLARALTARLARRFLKIATVIFVVIVAGLALLTWALAYFFSPWWWLLLVPLAIVALVILLLRVVLMFIIRQIHRQSLTQEQAKHIDQFIDKVQSLLEARATPFPLIVLICLKDLLVHRDIVTVKSVIKDSAQLTSDYRQLEKLFN
ncbi:MAG: hypothetical protein QG649_661 [Patescibacteria group bacterium]|nr:hypothetical protein [Patescibacteria group bacterium]